MKPYYQDEWVTIYHGDCREILPELPKVDLVLTDPPYGITSQAWDNLPDWSVIGDLLKGLAATDCQMFFFGMQPTFSDMIVGLRPHLRFKDEIIWHYKDGGAGNTKGTGLKNVHQNLAWFSAGKDNYRFNIDEIRIAYQPNKRNQYPVKRGNRIWTPNPNGAYPTNIFECPKHKEIESGRTQFHEHYTIKPVALIERVVRGFSDASALILDPFLGSGTTAVAAKKLNRYCIGIEIEEKYCEIAAKRCQQQVFDLGI